MTWTPWLIPVGALGLALLFAPVLGEWLARDRRPRHCERCGRELVGSPPEHTYSDRLWCRQLAETMGDVL